MRFIVQGGRGRHRIGDQQENTLFQPSLSLLDMLPLPPLRAPTAAGRTEGVNDFDEADLGTSSLSPVLVSLTGPARTTGPGLAVSAPLIYPASSRSAGSTWTTLRTTMKPLFIPLLSGLVGMGVCVSSPQGCASDGVGVVVSTESMSSHLTPFHFPGLISLRPYDGEGGVMGVAGVTMISVSNDDIDVTAEAPDLKDDIEESELDEGVGEDAGGEGGARESSIWGTSLAAD
jgi:hypothetical protein